MTLFHLEQDLGRTGPLRRAQRARGTDFSSPPALFVRGEESPTKQKEDCEARLSSRSDGFAAQKEFIKIKMFDQTFLPSNETALRERRSGGGGDDDQRATATVHGRCRAAIKPISLFNEKITIRRAPLTQI